ncbi:MAG TPA: FGGY-family carbohydrate kinase, partial [Candidatus Dormibacteraeota bacterium]
IDAALRVLSRACSAANAMPAAISVAGAAGTRCFRDSRGPCSPAVAYDDARFGAGLDRVIAWRQMLTSETRVVPITDAVLEALGAEPGWTDWTNALKLGWDPRAQAWPAAARSAVDAGFLPRAAPPGARAGLCAIDAAPGAVLARGATDSCAMHIASAGLAAGAWSVSLGTTVTWKTTLDGAGPPALDMLPRGAYAHRLAPDVWLAAAAGNSGGGVLEADADLAGLDRIARLPSGFAAYPLARIGERYPVADASFGGFGMPHPSDPRHHAAALEGVAFVLRLGIQLLVAAGTAAPAVLHVTGGGARSGTWMRALAAGVRLPVVPLPDAGPALGAALLAAAALDQAPLSHTVTPPAQTQPEVQSADAALADSLEERYQTFTQVLQIVT